MSQPFSPQLSLKSLKHQAKQLLKNSKIGDWEALEAWSRVKAMHPRLSPSMKGGSLAEIDFSKVDFSLQDAQFVVAREYGYASWPKLVAAVTGEREEEPLSAEDAREGDPAKFLFRKAFDLDMDRGPAVRDLSEILFRGDAMILNVGLPGETSDYISRQIACEYTLEGEFVRQIGEIGEEIGKYTDACRIALDPSGNLYVYDGSCRGTCRISVYDQESVFVKSAERGEDFPYTYALLFDGESNLLQLACNDGVKEEDGVYKLRKYRELGSKPLYVRALTPHRTRVIDNHHSPGYCYRVATNRLFFMRTFDYEIMEIDAETGDVIDRFGTEPPDYRPIPEKYLKLDELPFEMSRELGREATSHGRMTLLNDRYILIHFVNFPEPFPGWWMLYDLDSQKRTGMLLQSPAFYNGWATKIAGEEDLLYAYYPPRPDSIHLSNGYFKVFSFLVS